ncbi:hypothetical protein HPB51_000117 [Rhipicephalus microplus]|uniref:Uncharacterized protein n=1 Tax=Rhipicephalus microplus TaxID=6941 RepID=A0A9J6EJU6_RHIMP|nr:hypothetical protein HPB51_000117 [Rhipicephalus microplus]
MERQKLIFSLTPGLNVHLSGFCSRLLICVNQWLLLRRPRCFLKSVHPPTLETRPRRRSRYAAVRLAGRDGRCLEVFSLQKTEKQPLTAEIRRSLFAVLSRIRCTSNNQKSPKNHRKSAEPMRRASAHRGPLAADPQGSSEEVDNVSAGERHDGAAWTEDGWHTVLTRRQKKNQKKNQKNASEAVECNASSSSPPKQGSQVKRRRRTRSRRPLPPLPKDDIKIILRPHKGLAVPPTLRRW